ncbi:molecular chaperone TorD family protein [Eggerthellaceae bacterium zg-1084]|uniref:TorD/DmsD family molecular chaperone n=1 Tax=Berryella wangjianweii TaxID=2734634 RepID=UPI001553855E|nr:molecular chaperone TorD family protein [Berryella wangjianweii]NPD31431.1 molecular chaperone TorD family protein [Berryella wangjianweii]
MTGEPNTTDAPELDEARYREAIYRTLASLFSDAPSAQALGALIEAADGEATDGLQRPSEREFCAYLRTLSDANLNELRTKVASEYAELFVGPRPPLAPLYESVYRGGPRRLFSEQTMRVRAFYERCELTVANSGRVPDDHVAFELELMARLTQREAEAVQRGLAEEALGIKALQREFLTHHLGRWIGLLCERVCAAPCSDFYAALANLACSFVREDAAGLAASIRRLEGSTRLQDQEATSPTTFDQKKD